MRVRAEWVGLMQQEVELFLNSAGQTVVTALAGDTYRKAKEAVVAVWRRFVHFGADELDAQLEQAHLELTTAGGPDPGRTEADLAARWQQQLQPLFSAAPEAAAALLAALVEAGVVAAPSAGQAQTGDRRLEAKASGHAHIYQAGNDLYVNEGR